MVRLTLVLLLASAAPAEAARPVVVELFTSQACSSVRRLMRCWRTLPPATRICCRWIFTWIIGIT
ncbi:MAG: hypothetical protein WDN04_23660 [Rhodospirillales bacterium]